MTNKILLCFHIILIFVHFCLIFVQKLTQFFMPAIDKDGK